MFFKYTRQLIFYWFVDSVWHVSIGERLPVALIFLRFVLLPIDTAIILLGRNEYDIIRDVFTIFGVEFSRQFFFMFANRKNIGKTFKVVMENGGIITLTEVVDETEKD